MGKAHVGESVSREKNGILAIFIFWAADLKDTTRKKG